MPVWTPYAVTTAILVVVAVLGMRATDIGPWYRALRKPRWQPPDWLFGPAWTTIYVCIVASVGLAWQAMPPGARVGFAVLFALNIGLNILWSYLFFAWRRPDRALLEIVPLWLSILALIVYVAPHRELSGWLLTPYLVWVAFAANLNRVIVKLNPDAHLFDPDTVRRAP